VNVFDTGVFNAQGRCQPELKAALDAAPAHAPAVKPIAAAGKTKYQHKGFCCLAMVPSKSKRGVAIVIKSKMRF